MSKKTDSINKLSNRSKKYSQNLATINEKIAGRDTLEVTEAVEILQSLNQPGYKDGASLELHINLNINPTKSDQLVRDSVTLPHGTGKKVVVAAFVTPEKEAEAKKAGADLIGGEDLVEKIKKDQKVSFDKAVAEPAVMKNLAAIARILGVAGVMPNPKTETVGPNIADMISKIKAGKVDFKNDKTGNLHILCGKLNNSFDTQKLTENVEVALQAVRQAKPEAIKKKFILKAYLSTSLSPSIRII
jgi:large subunit ribosomal protein L1